jgi:hypothetical protein
MSENLDLVRSIYAAWGHGEFSSSDWAHPEMLYEYADGPSPGAWAGIEGIATGFRDFLGAWVNWGVLADDFRGLAGERVLVSFRFAGRGKVSGSILRICTPTEQRCSKSATARSQRASSISTKVAPSPTSAWESRRPH